MDTAEAIGFYSDGFTEKRGGETRTRSFGAKSVAKAFAFLYPLSFVGRLVKRKVTKAAHRVADRAADQVAERAAQILRAERRAEELARAARADADEREPVEENPSGDETMEEKKCASSAVSSAAAADDSQTDASTAEVALPCEMAEKDEIDSKRDAHVDPEVSRVTRAVPEIQAAAAAAPDPATPEKKNMFFEAAAAETLLVSPPARSPLSGWDLVEDGVEADL